jgi:hypothetical protein
MNDSIRQEINEIHQLYLNQVKPIVIDCESTINETPLQSHNEIRHGFDHIARVEADGLTDIEAKEILELGKKHFERAVVEAYEIKTWFLSGKINNIISNLEISLYARAFKGEIYEELYNAQKEALKLYDKAREIKSDNRKEASILFQNAFDILEKALIAFFKKNSSEEYLKMRDKHDNKLWILSVVLSFIIGILSGVISSILFQLLLSKFNHSS